MVRNKVRHSTKKIPTTILSARKNHCRTLHPNYSDGSCLFGASNDRAEVVLWSGPTSDTIGLNDAMISIRVANNGGKRFSLENVELN